MSFDFLFSGDDADAPEDEDRRHLSLAPPDPARPEQEAIAPVISITSRQSVPEPDLDTQIFLAHPVNSTAPAVTSPHPGDITLQRSRAGTVASARENLAAIKILRLLDEQGRPATEAERAVLSLFHGWGALPQMFSPSDLRFVAEREELGAILSDKEMAAAKASTINAHYTPPFIAGAMWDALEGLGFKGGEVFEPGCGSGIFMGAAPPSAHMVGVEIDGITAAITAAIYPDATVVRASIADARFPAGHFDAAIGNVPFADVTPSDPELNRERLSLHNYAIRKAVHLVRPGGVVALLTSRYTLDSATQTAREVISGEADLLGAVRFPEGAFRYFSGTDVVIDLLLLRRREESEEPLDTSWTTTRLVSVDGTDQRVSSYFVEHPGHVLGDLHAVRGMYRAAELSVTGPLENLDERLAGVLDEIVAKADASPPGSPPVVTTGTTTPPPATSFRRSEPRRRVEIDRASHPVGTILFEDEKFYVVEPDGSLAPFPVPAAGKSRDELYLLVQMRDLYLSMLEAEMIPGDDDTWRSLQDDLNKSYDAYVKAFGYLNRVTITPIKSRDTDDVEHEEDGSRYEVKRTRRTYPKMAGFKADPHAQSLFAIENYDPDLGVGYKADALTTKVLGTKAVATHADSPADALAISLARSGAVDVDLVAALLSIDPAKARQSLSGLVYEDPDTKALVPAAKYLSGNLRLKLQRARVAVGDGQVDYEPNVEALLGAMPAPVPAEEIAIALGAPFVDEEIVTKFAREVLDHRYVTVRHLGGARWIYDGYGGIDSWSVAATTTWGTSRAPCQTLLMDCLHGRLHIVRDTYEDPSTGKERTRLNAAETLAARECQEKIQEAFSDWVLKDPDRRDALATRYNVLFRSTVPPHSDGSHLECPGMSATFKPLPHQLDAAWRIVTEPTALIAHAVGAGKTATMAIAAMELKRMGIVRKPAIVVPNHMLDQVRREFAQVYPRAKILIAGAAETSKDERKAFVARCAATKWDAVIFTYSAFSRLPLSPSAEADYIEKKVLARMDAVIARAEKVDGRNATAAVKKLAKQRLRAEERYKALVERAAKDDGLWFDVSGIDYLLVDEAHHYKNLAIDSADRGGSKTGSLRATDLDAKISYLREHAGPLGHVASFSTATPIANSLSEMWVMQHYLDPDELERTDLADFDAWAATFGRQVTALEMAPDGSSYRIATRFARFANVPELLSMFHSFADVADAERLRLPRPDLKGGKAETVVVSPTEEARGYMATLVSRAEAIKNGRVRPGEDNMLLVSTDGRKLALDQRLVGLPAPRTRSKVEACADKVAEIYMATAKNTYMGTAGAESQRKGALQLVFCDTSTPNNDRWNAYDDLRARLVERGLPPSSIRFAHEANDDRQKARLFEACRSGEVSVLVASTAKAGVGTNIQDRAVALHHLDCPWRPVDIEQREGRIRRQGNQNKEVSIFNYVTEQTFDAYIWQTVERKAAFIAQVLHGDGLDREIEDVSTEALSYAEVKAIASGRPEVMEEAAVSAEIAKISRQAAEHKKSRANLAKKIREGEENLVAARERVSRYDQAIATRDNPDTEPGITVGDKHYYPLAAAADAAYGRLSRIAVIGEPGRPYVLGTFAGLSVFATPSPPVLGSPVLHLSLDGLHCGIEPVELRDTPQAKAGVLQRISAGALRLEDWRDRTARFIEEDTHNLDNARKEHDKPFLRSSELAHLKMRQEQLHAILHPEEAEEGAVEEPEVVQHRPARPSYAPSPYPSPLSVPAHSTPVPAASY